LVSRWIKFSNRTPLISENIACALSCSSKNH